MSARWSILVDRTGPVEYTNFKAPWEIEVPEDAARSVAVEFGDITAETARWWAAVLAPGQGWRTSVPHPQRQLLSPWTPNLDSEGLALQCQSPAFQLSSSSIETSPSFEDAAQYISDYYAYHSVSDRADLATQSRVAFAAALLLPLANLDNRNMCLPRPRMPLVAAKAGNYTNLEQAPSWGRDIHQLDRLPTLGCNPLEMRAVLGGVFYEPDIPSHVCGAWLQASFAVLRPNLENPRLLGSIFFARSPHIAFRRERGRNSIQCKTSLPFYLPPF